MRARSAVLQARWDALKVQPEESEMAKLTAEQRMASIEATQMTILQRLDAIEAQLATWTATFIKNDLLNRVVNLENIIGVPVVNPTAKKGK